MSRTAVVVLIILVLILAGGGFGARWGVPLGYGAGPYGLGVLGTVLIIILILALLGYV